MTASDITAEIGEPVVAYSGAKEYWIPTKTDVSNLPTVNGYEPIPDPNAD